MAMPVHANLLPCRLHYFVQYKAYQSLDAAGGGVTDGITDDNGCCSAVNSRGIEALDGLRIAAGSIFRDVHDFQTKRFAKVTAVSVVRWRKSSVQFSV